MKLVEDKGEPVCVGYRFYATAHDAAEAIWDEGNDPTEAVAHPCTEGKANVPDIAEHVLDTWAMEYEDPDAADIVLSDKASALTQELQLLLQEGAPVVWIPRTNERVQLPAIKATV